jgi:hypothetical protein
MASTNSNSPSTFQVEGQKMLNGLRSNPPATLKSVLVGGSSMTSFGSTLRGLPFFSLSRRLP